jgi:predicted ATPase/class 3 adenylate cyclase
MPPSAGVVTYLFTDIEGSTRLWEDQPDRMRLALARHDQIARENVQRHRGVVVKTTGDGIHAVFDDPLDAVHAAIALQKAISDPETTAGIPLRLRCGMHAGVDESRAQDFFGRAVNRAARIMSVAHGGQVLVSEAVATLVRDRLPPQAALRDLGTVRLRDLANSEHVYQIAHPELRRDFPALRSLEVVPNNLPQQLTSFVGREREQADVARMLATARLLTLHGVGGIGKTRLSLQVAADLLERFPDGTWLVEFAPLRDPRLVAQAVASVLGLKEELGSNLIDTLKRHVNDRTMLLVFDNCEHLVKACAELAKRLLESSRHVKILASSREPLHLAGEAIYPVPTLAVPASSDDLTCTSLERYDSIRLFLDRAAAARPSFQMTKDNAIAVGEIARRLDGIPLAIELAAARVRALSVKDIAARLDDRFRLLTAGDRTALPRQRTLRALIDWSYDLLDDRERAVLRRLAVFAGGWTVDAAEAVCPDDDLGESEVLDLLTALVEKSLVALEPAGGRYGLLDTVQQYASEKLNESGEWAVTSMRHLDFFLSLAEKARPELFGPEQAGWLVRLDLERENVLAAHMRCDSAEGGAGLGLRLVHAIKPYWLNRGLVGLGTRVTVEALRRSREPDLARCGGLADAGQLMFFAGNYADARRYLEESLGIARQLGDTRSVATVLQPLGMACLGEGDVATARACLQEALELARELGNKRELAAALNALAQLHRTNNELDLAEPLYEQFLGLARELRDREIVAIGLLNLAMVEIGRGSESRARDMLVEVHWIAREIGSKAAGQGLIDVACGLASLRGQWERVARYYGAAEQQTAQTGLHRDPADEAFLSPLIAAARGALAPDAFDSAESAGRALSYDEALSEVEAWLSSAVNCSSRSDQNGSPSTRS